jgi:hypothetical protein
MKLFVFYICIATLLSGCYSKGNSFFLGSGEPEYFLTMAQCEKEAKATYSDGSSKYSGYECSSHFLWFTLNKRTYYKGEIQ